MSSTCTMTPRLRHTLPVFTAFAAAGFYFIVLQMALSGAPKQFLAAHEQSYVPLSVTPKHPHRILDKALTPLLSFFVAAFGELGSHSTSYAITLDFVWSFGAAIQLPLIEASRPGASKSWLLTIPMVWGILYQRVSGGWIIPLWLLVWMHAPSRVSGHCLEKLYAQSVLAGWWLGHTLPAMIMLIPGMPPFRSAPIWIAFPILMSVAQQLYLLLARFVPAICKGAKESGYTATQYIYMSSLLGSAIAHLHVVIVPGLSAAITVTETSSKAALVAKLKGLFAHLWAHFVPPSFAIPTPDATTAVTGVKHFVQFDVIIVFGAVWIAGIWDLVLRRRAEDVKTRSNLVWILTAFALLLVGGLLLGPGGATAALFMYREKLLEDQRNQQKVASVDVHVTIRKIGQELSPKSAKYELYT